jgi:hypothetical protein
MTKREDDYFSHLVGRKLGSKFADGFVEVEDLLARVRDLIECPNAARKLIDEAAAMVSEMKFAYALSNLRDEEAA